MNAVTGRTAADRLSALRGQTAALQQAVSAETATLNALAREARAGAATVAQVAAQQATVSAARMMLDQHLSDVQEAHDQALQEAQEKTAADLLEAAQIADSEVLKCDSERLRLAAELEAHIQPVLRRMAALYGARKAAKDARAGAYRRALLNLFPGVDAATVFGASLAAKETRLNSSDFLERVRPGLDEDEVMALHNGSDLRNFPAVDAAFTQIDWSAAADD